MKSTAGHVKEVFVLRSLACLGIVIYNTLSMAITHFSLEGNAERALELQLLHTVQLLLMYSTPMFVFISELLLAMSYEDRVPAGFFKKRAKYILIPYVSIACFYSLIETFRDESALTIKDYFYVLAKNIVLADFFGYFLLVIFQFYVLHVLFVKYVYGKFSMPYVIGVATAVNVLYLAPFNLFDLTASLNVNYYFVNFMNKVPFIAWISYFVIAFYCGKNYERMLAFLRRNIKWIYVLTAAAASTLLVLYDSGVIAHVYSKRFDVLFYTIGVICCMLYWSSKMREVPFVLMRLSQYSFSIFLLSRFVLSALDYWLPAFYSEGYLYLFIGLCFVASIAGSMVISHLLNRIKYGPLLVGKIGIGPQKRNRDRVQRSIAGNNT